MLPTRHRLRRLGHIVPVITGIGYQDYMLTISNGAPGPYQWLRAGLPIPGATAPHYFVQVADEGQNVQCSASGVVSNIIRHWVPTDAASAPQGWSRARDVAALTLSGAAVDAWAVGGSVGGSLVGTVGQRPTYSLTGFGGRPGVTFDGTSNTLDGDLNLNYLRNVVGSTIAMAAQTLDSVGTRRAVNVCTASNVVTRMGLRQGAGVMQVIGTGGGDAEAFTSLDFGTPTLDPAVYVGLINHAADTALGSINGVATSGAFVSTGSTSDTASARRRIGAAVNGDADFWTGPLAEFIIWGIALGTTDRQKAEGYLAWANRTVGALDSAHPHKLFPPTL